MRMPSLLFTSLIVGSSCFGCGQSLAPSAIAPAQVAHAPAHPAGQPDGNGNVAQAAPAVFRKIIYTSHIEVSVDSLTVAQQRLTTLIESIQARGGFLASQEVSGAGSLNRRGVWTIRVPLAEFDSFVTELEKLGDVHRNSRDAQDVTEAYTDLEARLRNKQASEQRLLGHLDKSTDLKSTLELEREISRVRGEVEQMQGQLNLLKSKTDLATVSVTIQERQNVAPPMAQGPFIGKVSRTFVDSCMLLSTFCQGALLVIAALAPWIVASCVLLLPVWWISRGRLTPTRRNVAH